MDLQLLIGSNATRWASCRVLPKGMARVLEVASEINTYKYRYLPISTETGVPWWVIGIIHYREADFDFSCSIAQGDPWAKISTHVPRGRGPFSTFDDAAKDALVKCAPFAGRWHDWSPGGALTILELYNGTGYEQWHHEASPYIWAATNHEEWGKYTSDGHWDPKVWDTQIGAAAILKELITLDPTIFGASGG